MTIVPAGRENRIEQKSMHGPVICLVDAYGVSANGLAQAFGEAGCRLIHLRSASEVPPYYAGSYAPHLFHATCLASEPDMLETLREQGIHAVMAGSESGIMLADTVAEALHLPGNPPRTSARRRNKYAMGEAVRAAGLAAIRQAEISSCEEAAEIARSWAVFPLVVKPVESLGNDGIYFCNDENEVQRAVRTLIGARNLIGSTNSSLLVQERLFGQQYFINAFSHRGRHHVTEIWRDERIVVAGAGNIYDREILQPPTGPVQDQLVAYARQVLDALDVREGPTHAEFMLTAQGPVLIELGARLQGGLHSAALCEGLGASMISHAVQLCLDPSAFETAMAQGYHIRKKIMVVSLIAARSGILVANRCETLLPTLASYFAIVGSRPVGARLQRTVDLATNPGHIFLIHEDAERLEADYRTIRDWEARDVLLDIRERETAFG